MPGRARDTGNDAVVSLRGWAEEAQAAAGIAHALAPTAFVPEHLRVYTNPKERDPDKRVLDLDLTVQQVTAVLLAGQELQFGPMASLRAFVIIRGSVALFALAARALLLHNGHEIVVDTKTNSTRAIVHGRRAGSPDWQTATWDTDRAREAGLLPGHPDGNWRRNTKAMLIARATAEVCRWVAADAMLGLPLIAEEVQDNFAGIDEAAEASEGPPDVPAKHAAKRKPTTARAALPAGPPLPSPGGPSSEPPPGVPRPSKPQLARLHAGLRELGITGKDEGLALVSAWAARPVTSTGHLSPGELDTVFQRIEALTHARARDAGEDQPPPADTPDAAEEAAPNDQPDP